MPLTRYKSIDGSGMALLQASSLVPTAAQTHLANVCDLDQVCIIQGFVGLHNSRQVLQPHLVLDAIDCQHTSAVVSCRKKGGNVACSAGRQDISVRGMPGTVCWC